MFLSADVNINSGILLPLVFSQTHTSGPASQSASFVSTGGIDPIIRGVIGSPALAHSVDMVMSDEVMDRLIVLNVPQPMDLAALNLQRGRDHALPGYCRRRNRTDIGLNLASQIQYCAWTMVSRDTLSHVFIPWLLPTISCVSKHAAAAAAAAFGSLLRRTASETHHF